MSESHFSQPFDADKHLKLTQIIFARMARENWVVDPDPVKFDPWWNGLTEAGRQRVEKISDALIRSCPSVFKAGDLSALSKHSVRQPTAKELCAALSEVAPLIEDLKTPPFSPAEAEMLIGMLYYFTWEHCKGLIPPSGGYRPPPV
jgi:hypothetical protein